MDADDEEPWTPKSDTAPNTSLLDIGEDVLLYIMEFLSPFGICNLSLVCERMRQLSNDDRAWLKIVSSSIVCTGDSGEMITPRSPYREWYQSRLMHCRSDMVRFIDKEENFGFADINLENIKSMYKLCKKAMMSSTHVRNRQFSSTHAKFFRMASRFAQRNRFFVSVIGCSVRGFLELSKGLLGQVYPNVLAFNFAPRRVPSLSGILKHYHRLVVLIICVAVSTKPPSWSAVQTGGNLVSSSTFYYLASVLISETGMYNNLTESDVMVYQGLNSPWRRRFAVAFSTCQILLALRDAMRRRISSASLLCVPLVTNLLFNTWLFKYHFSLASAFAKIATLGAVTDLEAFIPDERTQMATSRLILPFYNKQHIAFRICVHLGTTFINPYLHFPHAAHYRWALVGTVLNILIRINTSTVTAIYGNVSGYCFHMCMHLLLAAVPLISPSETFEDLYRKKAS
eukprot:TRINITY_DN14444_c0_g1_i11.p1 TRINITY_DN14444_c0_g1~~TRINITY_DN14444_c0_g1_i11.p1  ORF type:complete len:456 (+),score=17.57 TRINITY_DN14444_c0_g1_i11:53-1420(+)